MFQLGERIRFRYTGALAEIVQVQPGGTYLVYLLEDKEEIVAFAEDMVKEADFKGVERSPFKKPKKEKGPSTEELFFSKEELAQRPKNELYKAWEQQQGKKSNTPPPTPQEKTQDEPVFIKPVIQPQASQDAGLWLALLEVAPREYAVYLINDTPKSLGFRYTLYLGTRQTEHFHFEHRIAAREFFAIGDLSWSELEDAPTLEIILPAMKIDKQWKPRAHKLAKDLGSLPLMGVQGSRHLLMPADYNPYATHDLLRYTQDHLRQQQKPSTPPPTPLVITPKVDEVAAFVPEIDLHLEKLVEYPKNVDPKDILTIQLRHFERFLNEGIRLDVKELYIIHGLGEGRLRGEIEYRLKHHPKVKEFRNEYHPKYGYGATQVVLY